jgi:predicted transcriptional regulator
MESPEIRKRRRALDLTQQQVANQCDISPAYLSLIERGKIRTKGLDHILHRIERALSEAEQHVYGQS